MRKLLIIFTKNAVNAIITNSALLGMWHSQVNFTHDGLVNILRVAGACIFAREAIVLGPKIIAWSTSPTPNDK